MQKANDSEAVETPQPGSRNVVNLTGDAYRAQPLELNPTEETSEKDDAAER